MLIFTKKEYILFHLISVIISVIISNNLVRWLTFLLRSQTVTITVLPGHYPKMQFWEDDVLKELGKNKRVMPKAMQSVPSGAIHGVLKAPW